MKRRRSNDITVVAQKIDDAEIAGFANSATLVHHRAQRFRYSWPGIEKVDIHTARTIVAGRHCLRNPAIFPRPSHAPGVHGANAFGSVLTQQLSERLVA